MRWPSLGAITSVAYKEFLHIYRDRRVLLLLLILPPVFTLIFGHAFEMTQLHAMSRRLLINRDRRRAPSVLSTSSSKDKTFHWSNAGARFRERTGFAPAMA